MDTARNIIVKFVEENSERVGKNTAKIANAQLAELLSLDQEKPIQRERMAKSIFDLLQVLQKKIGSLFCVKIEFLELAME